MKSKMCFIIFVQIHKRLGISALSVVRVEMTLRHLPLSTLPYNKTLGDMHYGCVIIKLVTIKQWQF